MSEKLNLTPLYDEIDDIKIQVSLQESEKSYPFDYGVSREIINGNLIIQLDKNCTKYYSIILLREAYRLFIPKYFREQVQFQFLIYMIIEAELERLSIVDAWKEEIRNYDDYSYYFANNFDALIKFLKLEDPDSSESVINFFFQYIRSLENKPITDSIFDNLGLQFLEKMKSVLKKEDILETIRILKLIFYKVRSYRALLAYQEFFKEMKASGEIKTDLSIRKFVNNVRILNQRSFCAPTYQLDWNSINLSFFMSYLRFDPNINWLKIKDLIKNLPFFTYPRFYITGLTGVVVGYFVLPNSYVNDLKNYITFLKERGYVREGSLFKMEKFNYFSNLNYLHELSEEGKFINSKSKHYRKDFELEFSMEYTKRSIIDTLSILDFLILDRARHISITGFSFERREATLTELKSDLLNEISHQRKIIRKLKEELEKFSQSDEISNQFLELLQNNQSLGFFVIKRRIFNILKICQLIPSIYENKKKISTIKEFKEIAQTSKNLGSFDDKLILNDNSSLKIVFNDILPLYLNNKNKFKSQIDNLNLFYEFLENCKEMKIFNIKKIQEIITNLNLSSQIYRLKEKKFERIYNESLYRKITSQEVEDKLEFFSSTDPPVIHPMLLQSIPFFTLAGQTFILFLNYSSKVLKKLEALKVFFPSFIINLIKDEFSGKKLIFCEYHVPNLSTKERTEFISIINMKFSSNIIIHSRFFNPGMMGSFFSRRDYYDYMNGTFLYKSSLFEEFKKFTSEILGPEIPLTIENKFEQFHSIWGRYRNISQFTEKINSKRYRENVKLDHSNLEKLSNFHQNIDEIILKGEDTDYKGYKEMDFYKTYIKKINLIPLFYKFALDKYYLYCQPLNPNELDFKLLLTNTFQSFRIITSSPNFVAFYIKFIFPLSNPNLSYINWLLLSKKIFSEYILFSIDKIIRYANFYQNIEENDWLQDISSFESHIHKILFESRYKPPSLEAKSIKFHGEKEILSPNAPDFEDLKQIYQKESLNLKRYIKTKLGGKIEPIVKRLLNKNKISTYISFKNIKLNEKIHVIIPNISETQKNKIINIFRFFILVRIYEINGEFYVHSFQNKKFFKNGLSIKIWFPKLEISAYIELLIKVFGLLNIKHYFIVNEKFKSKPFLGENFGDYFFALFNPLENLLWNDTDKKWQNWKLFSENFEHSYPPLKRTRT